MNLMKHLNFKICHQISKHFLTVICFVNAIDYQSFGFLCIFDEYFDFSKVFFSCNSFFRYFLLYQCPTVILWRRNTAQRITKIIRKKRIITPTIKKMKVSDSCSCYHARNYSGNQGEKTGLFVIMQGNPVLQNNPALPVQFQAPRRIFD